MSAALAAGVAAGIVLGVALAWWLVSRARARARIAAPEDAAAAAEAGLTGFETAGALLAADGRAALVVASDGRVALVRPRGRPREVGWTAVRAAADGVVVEARGSGPVALNGVDALDLRRLAGTARAGV